MLHKRQITNQWYHATVQELFAETCQDRPEKTAIVYEDQQISYKELKENVIIWRLIPAGKQYRVINGHHEVETEEDTYFDGSEERVIDLPAKHLAEAQQDMKIGGDF